MNSWKGGGRFLFWPNLANWPLFENQVERLCFSDIHLSSKADAVKVSLKNLHDPQDEKYMKIK